MAVSATFNVGDLTHYVEDVIEDPSNLRPNPHEKGEANVRACPKESKESTWAKEVKNNQHCPTRFKPCFLFLALKLALFWEALFDMILWSLLDESYFFGLPYVFIFARI